MQVRVMDSEISYWVHVELNPYVQIDETDTAMADLKYGGLGNSTNNSLSVTG
jgi:hypothetical protein